ncbi:MAG: hypothetical protein EP317_03630 [Bacillota bacterium]|nr:MAG: hypothetical protein EP317_03630 [Bacillota bacterium]
MSKSYVLPKGTYVVGDPAILIKKSPEGNDFIEALWAIFYEDHNQFHEINLDGVKLYITRTKGGDGRFNGIGTDTGTIMIMNTLFLEDDSRFRDDLTVNFIKVLTFDKEETVTVDHFDIYFESGFTVITE